MNSTLITVILTIVGLVLFTIPMIFFMRWKNRHGASRFDDMIIYNERIYVSSNIYHSGGDGDSYSDCRITELDQKSGFVVRTLIPKRFSRLEIIGELKDKIWFKENERFCVLDTEKFEIVFDDRQIGDKLNELKDVKIKEIYINETDKNVYFVAENAYKYSIDPHSFDIKRVEKEPYDEVKHSRQKNEFVNNFDFKKMNGSERYQLTYKNKRIESDNSYISPELLYFAHTYIPVVLDNPERILLKHSETLNSVSGFILSLINSTGQILWSFKQNDLEAKISERFYFKNVRYCNPFIYIAGGEKKDRIFCIDIEKGKLIWNTTI